MSRELDRVARGRTRVSKADQQDRRRYEALKQQLTELEYLRRGSVVRRFTTCGKTGCACQADPPRLHGPYYQWTRKVKGKTLTVRLPERHATLFQEWIANARKMNVIIAHMERLSTRITRRILSHLP